MRETERKREKRGRYNRQQRIERKRIVVRIGDVYDGEIEGEHRGVQERRKKRKRERRFYFFIRELFTVHGFDSVDKRIVTKAIYSLLTVWPQTRVRVLRGKARDSQT